MPSAVPRRPAPRAFGLIAVLFLIGSLGTAYWLSSLDLVDARTPSRPPLLSAAVLGGLALCVALTSLNLVIRWFRWHFLIRRFTRNVVTRDSLTVYLATLPAIVTPFFVGELVRVLILRRRSGTRTAHLAWVWLIERIIDAAVLLVFLLLALDRRLGLAAVPVLLAVAFVLFRLLLEDRRARNVIMVGAIALATTTLAWLLPVLALGWTLALRAQR